MSSPEVNRRDFHRLSLAAVGGVLTGAVAGCGGNSAPSSSQSNAPVETPPPSGKTETAGEKGREIAGEPHACSGLNACKNQGASGQNECAGQGDCATAAWHHTCGGQNDCKGQGGCGTNATLNDCKGKGACHIPLMAGAWKAARKHFEEKMTADGKTFGAGTPPKKK
ncbi:MAG: hypothetical protein JSS02_29245 [Planctomycetes bacterium]|nr:hypothetical protein [Planctomycetota bacterium]